VLNSQQLEYQKFIKANSQARDIGMQILALFAALIPVVGLFANLATLVILVMGGHYVILDRMTLGDFTAFNSYLTLLIFPIFILGFMSNVIARASASYQRIDSVLYAKEPTAAGTLKSPLKGNITVSHVSLKFGEKTVLKDVSFSVKPGSRLAVIGPTGEGKTQLMHILAGLTPQTTGEVLFDGHPLSEYEQVALHQQLGLVFQDSSMFNLTIRENIAFSTTVSNAELQMAIETAELSSFIEKLPNGLETIVSERGTSLSGGQKQRIMLARALALNPKILLLDDFTARVDTATEQKIVKNVKKNYPDLTLLSVTQKISSVKDYDQIVLLMDGEILASGTHKELVKTSPEYVQIYNSQKSTSHYELLSE
jgi:ATP-binding cassette subfamily B protein